MPLSASSYLLCSIGVGAAQIVDAVALLRAKKRTEVLAIAFSFAEYGWAVVSFFVWQQAQEPFPHWLPVAFIAYVMSFMAAGLLLATMHRDAEQALPNHLVAAGGIFGTFFALASLLAFAQA